MQVNDNEEPSYYGNPKTSSLNLSTFTLILTPHMIMPLRRIQHT